MTTVLNPIVLHYVESGGKDNHANLQTLDPMLFNRESRQILSSGRDITTSTP